jgi:hypothetical protein
VNHELIFWQISPLGDPATQSMTSSLPEKCGWRPPFRETGIAFYGSKCRPAFSVRREKVLAYGVSWTAASKASTSGSPPDRKAAWTCDSKFGSDRM